MIVHFDLDAFYASVAQRDDPSLRGKPVAVAGRSRRAVVLTASYEARPFGVRSAIPLYRALDACPGLIVVPPDFPMYRAVSQAVFAIFADGARAVEGLSLDEAYVDVPTDELESVVAFARRVRARVLDEVGLTVSAGVASGKMVAKIASDACKPDGLAVVAPGTECAYLAPMPVGRLWGVGPKTQERLREAGIATIGDVAALDDAQAYELFGRGGKAVRALASGDDDRTVSNDRERKSVSTEETFERDVTDEAVILETLSAQAEELAAYLQKEGLRGGTIGVKVKRADFTIIGRQTALAVPVATAADILAASIHCWRRTEMVGKPLRLLGTRIASLTIEPQRELSLFS